MALLDVAALCGMAGKVGLCADFSVMRGDAVFLKGTAPQEAVVTYAGLTVGVAQW